MGRRKPRRGRSVARVLTVLARRGSTSPRTKALKTDKGVRPLDPREWLACLVAPPPGRGKRNHREERHEGKPAVTSRRGCGDGTNP
jgi:hypothetical protein